MEKTLKQIADELKIDKQQVYRFVQKNRINEARIDAKTKYYDEVAQDRIKSHFSNNKSHQHDAVIDAILKQNEALMKQIEIKDNQIQDLHKLLDQEQKLNAMNQQKIQALEDKQKEDNQKKHWFFSRG